MKTNLLLQHNTRVEHCIQKVGSQCLLVMYRIVIDRVVRHLAYWEGWWCTIQINAVRVLLVVELNKVALVVIGGWQGWDYCYVAAPGQAWTGIGNLSLGDVVSWRPGTRVLGWFRNGIWKEKKKKTKTLRKIYSFTCCKNAKNAIIQFFSKSQRYLTVFGF